MAQNYPSRSGAVQTFRWTVARRSDAARSSVRGAACRPRVASATTSADVASHPINALVASRDLFPIEVLKKFRDVLFSMRVIVRVGVLTHVAHYERVGAEPDAVVVAIHDRVVPAVVVRIVHEDGPALRGEGGASEIGLPTLDRSHVL